MKRSLTEVSGLRVGHATVDGGGSGCTVILGPFRGAVEVPGLATGTRELATLDPEHLVPRVDAILLTGGSAFGLAAADGVMAWLAERGLGYESPAGPVPIVPAAVIYDLAEGRPYPDASLGRAACDAATEEPVRTGRVGAGAGATVGKLSGPGSGAEGGLGSAAVTVGLWTVGALAVVNSVGVVLDAAGRVVAGDRGAKGEVGPGLGPGPASPGTNTTLAVVATDAPLGAIDLRRLGRLAVTAFARRIDPVHTPFDGDLIFLLSTAEEERRVDPPSLTRIALGARRALEESIADAVEAGR